MIEQFLSPTEWAQVWSEGQAFSDASFEVFKELTSYGAALRLERPDFDDDYFVHIMTTLSILELALQRKFPRSATQ